MKKSIVLCAGFKYSTDFSYINIEKEYIEIFQEYPKTSKNIQEHPQL